jgi:hypothetical protein
MDHVIVEIRLGSSIAAPAKPGKIDAVGTFARRCRSVTAPAASKSPRCRPSLFPKSYGLTDIAFRTAHRRFCACTIRSCPAFVVGPVLKPPWFAQRPPRPSPLRRQGWPALVRAPHGSFRRWRRRARSCASRWRLTSEASCHTACALFSAWHKRLRLSCSASFSATMRSIQPLRSFISKTP